MSTLKPYFYLAVYIFVSIIFVSISRDLGNPFIQNLWLWGTFIILVKKRLTIAGWLMRYKRLPVFFVFLIFSYPFMLVEENINCLSVGCKLIPITIPFLSIYLALIYFFVKRFKMKRFWLIMAISCSIGVLFELAIGDASAEFQALSPPSFIVAFSLIWIMYAYIVVIPLTYLIEKRNSLSK